MTPSRPGLNTVSAIARAPPSTRQWARLDVVPDTAHLRRDYGSGRLDDHAVAASWREQFDDWFAAAAGLNQPQAAVLATVDAQSRPRARTVLIKSGGGDGLVWATNYESRKG